MAVDDPREPTLANLLALHREATLKSIRGNQPGIITAYDSATQRASVQLALEDAYRGEQSERISEPQPEIHDVPVTFLGTTGGRITWPVAIGNTCIVWQISRSMAKWLNIGGVVDTEDDRTHDISDAFCMVAGHDFAHVPTDAPTDAIVTHGMTKLGASSGTQKTFRADDFLSAFGTLIDSIGTAVGGITGGGPAGTAIATAKTLFDTFAATFKTSLVEVK